MKNNILKLIAIFFIIGVISFSCIEKDSASLTNDDYVTTSDNVYSERLIFDIFNIVNKGISTTKSEQSCPDYEWTNKELRVSYLDGCTETDGNEISGTIIANFSVDFDYSWSLGDNVAITFENYTVNGSKITGTINITCTSAEPLTFRFTSDDMLITSSNSNTISWKTTMDYTMLSGLSTVDNFSDDIWQIDGTSSGVGANGKNFTREAIALVKVPNCSIFVDGKIFLTVESNIYNIEFDEQCGNVIIEFNGNQFLIYMQ